jgi:hypothetical protein
MLPGGLIPGGKASVYRGPCVARQVLFEAFITEGGGANTDGMGISSTLITDGSGNHYGTTSAGCESCTSGGSAFRLTS